MRRVIAALLIVCLVPHAALAQAKPKRGMKGCFIGGEENAEAMVELGVQLREGARGCDADPWNAGTLPLWLDIDQRFGSRFAAQTATRAKAFTREFKDQGAEQLKDWDARLVYYWRHYPLDQVYCATIRTMLTQMQKKGWAYFAAQAKKGHDEVELDYRPCR